MKPYGRRAPLKGWDGKQPSGGHYGAWWEDTFEDISKGRARQQAKRDIEKEITEMQIERITKTRRNTMAGIDKIYGTQKDYIELKRWLLANEKPIRCVTAWSSVSGDEYSDVLPSDLLYEEDEYDKDYRPISNFTDEIDKWLMAECPLNFVIDRLKVQYPNGI